MPRQAWAQLCCALLALCFASVVAHAKPPFLFHSGAGLRSSLDDIVALFQARHPAVEIDLAYKGAGFLLADLARSGRGDLYMPGEEYYILQALERGLLESYDPEVDVAARFVTVIITPSGNPKSIRSLEDFARPGVRVGLGNPRACAIGIWHEKTFKRAGLWDKVRENASLSAKCIPELGNAAQHRLIDATIVWCPTAVLYLRDVEIVPLDARHRGVVRLPVAVLKSTTYPDEARVLKRLILSDEAKSIFRSHAYVTDAVPVDPNGFESDGGRVTEPLMRWLVNAARALKDSSIAANESTLGPLVQEVVRQRRTTRAGN